MNYYIKNSFDYGYHKGVMVCDESYQFIEPVPIKANVSLDIQALMSAHGFMFKKMLARVEHDY